MDMLDVISHKEFGPDYHKLSTKQKKEVHKLAIKGKLIKQSPFKESVNERNTSVNKRRAGAELKQKLKGKRSDGMGKYDGNIYGLDNDGKRVELKSLNDLNKFKKFELDADIEEAGPGFKHDCAAHVVHEVYGAGICLDEQHTLVKEGNKHVVTHYDVFFKKGNRLVEDVPAEHLKVITMNEHWHKGYKKKKK